MIRLLIYLRYVAVAGQLLAVYLAAGPLGLDIPTRPLYIAVAALLVFNLIAHLRHSSRDEARTPELVAHLCADLLALTAMLYFTGGPANPFVSLYLVPVALAATSLRLAPMLGVSLLAVALYSFLMISHVPMPHAHGDDFDLHVIGMWINFLLSAAIMVAVLGRFMSIVSDQRRRLAEARERALRDESLLAVGTLAAGTAHELNTPLTTMGLLIDALATSRDPPDPEDIDTLKVQLGRCREHVRTLAELARGGALGAPRQAAAADFLRDCVGRWQLLRPGVEVRLNVVAAAHGAMLRIDPTLPQALINLLDNAADAAGKTGTAMVEIELEIADGQCLLRILDRGPGPRPGAEAVQGEARGKGLGIGLLISNASIERAGGRVEQYPRPGGGCATEVVLPARAAV